MKVSPKHRAQSNAPRSGAAALMIGGLVAGTVAAAGATTLKPSDSSETASAVSASLLPVDTEQPSADAVDRAASLASLRSANLAELRDQVGADRSEARTAPEDAEIASVLANSSFSGHTPVVEEVVEEAPAEEEVVEEAVAAPATEEAAPQQTVEAAPARTETRSEPAPAPAPEPAPAPAPAPAPEPAPAPVGGGILGIAANYVGSPYVLPGNPPYTFDCSSYTWWVYQQAGISIPRTVSGQKAAVTPVSNPQPGDLIFYNDFYHVGIYAGNGMTYEALNPSAGVRYGPLVNTNVWYGRIG